jgi:hypothetical protein
MVRNGLWWRCGCWPCHWQICSTSPLAVSEWGFGTYSVLIIMASLVVDVSCPEGYEWYMAIGSMMNPTSLALRELTPVRSYPARVPGWQLVFKGKGGMASIDRVDSEHFHGVLHLMSHADMKTLDSIESIYNRHPVTCHLYVR